MNPPDDIFLVTRVIFFGERKAFEKLVTKYQSNIRRFFLNLTYGNKELSDDLSQETFIKAYLYLNNFRCTARFSTWLYRISYNVYYDYIRKTNREVSIETFDFNTDLSNSEDNSDKINLTMDLYESLKILREVEKTALILFYMEDLTHDKIAVIMNCPVGTVKSLILRGRDKLTLYFKNSGYER